MAIVRWDPFRDLLSLRSNIDRLFEETLGLTRTSDEAVEWGKTTVWAPPVDIEETDDKIVVRVEIPGMKQDEIDIQLGGDTLTIRGERKFEKEDKGKNYLRLERNYGSFSRSFNLGIPVQQDKVSAHYQDGILQVELPKAEEAKPKQIKIKIEK